METTTTTKMKRNKITYYLMHTQKSAQNGLKIWAKIWNQKVNSLSCVWLFATPWTVACQALLSMRFSRQECWSGLPFSSPETRKLLEENLDNMLFDTILSNIFLDTYPQAREAKVKINKWDYIKLKSFCTAKKTINNSSKIMYKTAKDTYKQHKC